MSVWWWSMVHITSQSLFPWKYPQGWLWKEGGIQWLDKHGAIDSLSHVAPSFILATSPALLGLVIGPPDNTVGLSRNEWFLARHLHPLFYTFLPFFLPSVESTAGSGWPYWLWFFLHMPTNIQREFWFKKRQLVNQRAFHCPDQETHWFNLDQLIVSGRAASPV